MPRIRIRLILYAYRLIRCEKTKKVIVATNIRFRELVDRHTYITWDITYITWAECSHGLSSHITLDISHGTTHITWDISHGTMWYPMWYHITWDYSRYLISHVIYRVLSEILVYIRECVPWNVTPIILWHTLTYVYIYMYICIYIYIHICMCTCIWYTHIHMYTCTYVYTHASASAYVHIRVHVNMYVYANMYVYVYM